VGTAGLSSKEVEMAWALGVANNPSENTIGVKADIIKNFRNLLRKCERIKDKG
jgi:hypothetical protein